MRLWNSLFLFLLVLTMINPLVLGSNDLNLEEEQTLAQVENPNDYWPDAEWRRSTPEEQGMNLEPLIRMIKYLQNEQKDIHSLLIIRNGYLINETYFYPYQKDFKHVINSCTKSVTSALIGIAIEEGYLKSVNEPVLPYFTDLKVEQIDAQKEALTIEHLLTMATGLDWVEDGSYGSERDSWTQMWQSPNQIQYILNRPMQSEPGQSFYYCTGASHLLSGILQRVTGKNAFRYGQEKLFEPMGIRDIYWQTDLNGVNVGGGGLYMTPADMAKFGYLYLKKGKWNGKQLIPEHWIEVSTQKQINTPYGLAGRYGYAYQWWINRFGGYSARGYGGQYIFVLPEYEMVIVFTSGLHGSDFFLPEFLVDSFIIPAIQPLALENSDVDHESELTELLNEVSQGPEPKLAPEMPVTAQRISGKTFMMEDNTSFSLLFEDDAECRLNLFINGVNYEIPIGLDDIYRIADLGIFGPLPNNNKVAFKGNWIDKQTFVITFKGLDDADELKVTYTFEKDQVKTSTYSKLAGTIVQEGKGIAQ